MISSAKSSFIAAFAEELHRAREYNGVTLDDLTSVTHISREFLEALEGGRWEALPQPYVRGYLQLYAQASGMNVEKVLQSYDRIVATPDDADSATLDLSYPLLRQPEHIGVTRAKIRTDWFAALVQNRKAAYVAMVVAIVILGTALYLSRKAQRPHTSVSPFEQTVTEYRETLRGPMTRLVLFASDSTARMSKSDTNRVELIGVSSGSVTIVRGNVRRTDIHFHAFDTLLIAYDTISYMSVSPPLSALIRTASGDSIPSRSTVSDSAYYDLSAKNRPVQTLEGDSL